MTSTPCAVSSSRKASEVAKSLAARASLRRARMASISGSTKSIRAVYQVHKNVREDAQNAAPDEFIANVEEKCNGNHLKLSVAKEARDYTVLVPATGRSWTYRTRAK